MKTCASIALSLFVGIILGYSFSTLWQGHTHAVDIREQSSDYKYINPLLACGDENFSKLGNDKLQSLEDDLTAYVNEKKATGEITDASIYFRELNGGTGININADTFFTPGSLLKVPLAMSVYQKAERNPNLLSKVIEYGGGEVPAEEHFKAKTISPGNKYTVEDLIQSTILYSDNNAAELLTMIISKDELDASYSHLGIRIPERGQDYTMAVKTYASFFRILYNATFIDHLASEHLLELLSQSTFKEGLVAGVPPGTVVAHKFGERAIQGQSSVQLHDCGVVYHPKQPYLICVMMRGKDLDMVAKIIAHLSKIAYQYSD